MEYNANGAICHILRNGKMQSGSYGAIDYLDIAFNGNQPDRVDDNATPVLSTGAFDFYDNKIKTSGTEYRYDENGALIYDANRGISNITYDLRNAPSLIRFSDGSQTQYIYSSDGKKVKTIHKTSIPYIMEPIYRELDINETKTKATSQTTPFVKFHVNDTFQIKDSLMRLYRNVLNTDSTEYLGNFIFYNGRLEKYLFNGGYYTYNGTGEGRTHFHYFVVDHLGNNRAVINGDGTIEQVTHYYPFGAPFADAGKNSDFQKYKYIDKELDLTHGLNTYDHGARQYYSLLGTWDRIDPSAEKYYNISPYAVCGNNPLINIDVDGNQVRPTSYEELEMIRNTLPSEAVTIQQ